MGLVGLFRSVDSLKMANFNIPIKIIKYEAVLLVAARVI